MSYRRGEFVTLQYEGQQVLAMVLLASPNGASLMLGFDGALRGQAGLHYGSMAVLRDRDGVYRDLVESLPATLSRRERSQR